MKPMKAMRAMKAMKAMKAMRAMKKKAGSKIAKGKKAKKLVFRGIKEKTYTGLTKNDLINYFIQFTLRRRSYGIDNGKSP